MIVTEFPTNNKVSFSACNMFIKLDGLISGKLIHFLNSVSKKIITVFKNLYETSIKNLFEKKK